MPTARCAAPTSGTWCERGPGTDARIDGVFLNVQKTKLNDPTMVFLGMNNNPGDYRSSGCTSCHMLYANDRSPMASAHIAEFGQRIVRPPARVHVDLRIDDNWRRRPGYSLIDALVDAHLDLVIAPADLDVIPGVECIRDGFSTWSLKAGDDAALALLRQVARALEPPLLDAGGHIVKRMGDGLMAVFGDPTVAVRAVLAAKEAVKSVEVGGYTPRMRVGIHTGRPQRLASDWLGVDVNMRKLQSGLKRV